MVCRTGRHDVSPRGSVAARVDAVPAVPARVCSCSVGADPAIPGPWLLCGGRSSHLVFVGCPFETSKVMSNPQQGPC